MTLKLASCAVIGFGTVGVAAPACSRDDKSRELRGGRRRAGRGAGHRPRSGADGNRREWGRAARRVMPALGKRPETYRKLGKKLEPPAHPHRAPPARRAGERSLRSYRTVRFLPPNNIFNTADRKYYVHHKNPPTWARSGGHKNPHSRPRRTQLNKQSDDTTASVQLVTNPQTPRVTMSHSTTKDKDGDSRLRPARGVRLCHARRHAGDRAVHLREGADDAVPESGEMSSSQSGKFPTSSGKRTPTTMSSSSKRRPCRLWGPYPVYTGGPGVGLGHLGARRSISKLETTLRPYGWTSADAAASDLPPPHRVDEATPAEIKHALSLRFRIRRPLCLPAPSPTGNVSDTSVPPMGGSSPYQVGIHRARDLRRAVEGDLERR